MKLIDTSVNRPVGVTIIVIAIMILGAVSLKGLAIDLLPNLEFPVAAVMTSYDGAAPEEIEKLVTKPLEGTIGSIQGLDAIQSTSAPNQSVLLLLFKYGTDLDQATLDLRDKIDMASTMLPEDAGKPTILKADVNAMPIMQLSLSGNIDQTRLTQIAEDTLQPRLERIAGVAQVSITGGKTKEINVEADPDKLNAYGLTLNRLVALISSENVTVSAGSIKRGAQDMALRIYGEFDSPEDIKNLIIQLPSGQNLHLSDVAKVEDTFAEQYSYSLVNGQQALSIQVSKQSDGNTVRVAQAVNAEMEKVKKDLPADVSLNTVYDNSVYIMDSINNVIKSMLIGGMLAVMVLFLFLRSIRTTIIIAISIPIALISTFTMIYFSGETINILTIGGLALGIGMMVDSSIVILENIFTYRQRGYKLLEAAKKGANEVGGAVIASALTSVMVFVPIVFTQGIAAEIFRPLALTVTFSLLAALFVALTLVPMLAGRLLKEVEPGQEGKKRWILGRISDAFGRGIERLNTVYGKVLKWSISHRKTIVFGTILLLVASFALIPLVGMEFIPSFDQGELMINVETPTGTQLSETAETMGELEQVLLDIPGVEMVFTTVGGNPMSGIPGPSNANAGSLYVRLAPLTERTISTNQVIERMNEHGKNMAGVTIKASGVQSADTGTPISVDLAGPDLEVLRTLSTEIENIVASVSGTTNVSSSMDDTRPELRILVDRELAAQYGLSFNEVMQSVRAGFNGQVATRMKVDGQEINVNVILPEENRNDVSGLENMTITNASGMSVPLSTVASLKQVEGPSTINRQNQERGVNVTGEVLGRNLASVVQDIQAKLDGITLPEGYTLSFGGQNEEMLDAFSSLLLALGLAVFLVYAVMAVQFESAMQPFIIMFSLPATFIGVILGFVITGRPLSVPSFIGLIMLVGLVVNNAIVLIDYINILRREGLSREEAILQAGPRRLRPILMTTLTTVLAMVPLVIGVGEGSEMQQPLATVIVFGLSFSTLITLVLVPVMYIYLDRLGSWWMGLFRRKNKKQNEEQVASVEA